MAELQHWTALVTMAVARELDAEIPAVDSLTLRFLDLLEADVRALVAGTRDVRPTVAGFAARLHYAPDSLGRAVRRESGRTAQDWLNDRLAAAATALLRHGDATVSNVAAQLGFADGSHFARFVRRHTGHSPGELRAGE